MSSVALSGFLEEVDTRDVKNPDHSLRRRLGDLGDLMASIAEKGLLQPIVVRPIEGGFEVVAGNRRLEACRRLRLSKIVCHIVELTDKEAFEMSLVENIQRQTLDPIEEAEALKRYVDEFGYGSTTELALKIGKSQEYVSHRIGLLSLPKGVLEKVSRRLLTPSHAEELRGLNESQQLLISQLIVEQKISSREVRKMAKQVKVQTFETAFTSQAPGFSPSELDAHVVDRTFGRCIAALKVTLMRFDDAVEGLGTKDWAVRESLFESRSVIHRQIDYLLRLKRKTQLSRVYLERQKA